MNNKLSLLILVVLAPLMLVLFMGAAPQISSVTESTERLADGYRITTVAMTADSTGLFPPYTTTKFFRGVLFQALTNPDSSLVPAIEDSSGRAPSTDYDITVISKDSLDVMGAALTDLSGTVTEWTPPKTADGTEWTLFVNSKVVIKPTGNIIPNARTVLRLYWWEK